MSASTIPLAHGIATEDFAQPYHGTVGMVCLIIAESAIFTIFVVAYLYYIGKSISGPQPREVLELPIFNTVCLLSSSFTIWLAERNLKRGAMGAFSLWWALTIVLGGIFLGGTALEWRKLIYHDGLKISTNLFGTTFYSLVGLHASHVIIGLTMLSIVLIFALAGKLKREHSRQLEVLSLYWHFVDGVWVVVFTVVYIIGR
ncbi:MAG TPA: heme-copper oxidase subunit III [Acidobacteriaceae bacterium]|jgi:cytochrome c oxidase subunit 3/cytochrome o ubiquinol oxidase subunit 3|nr:heme-copper oxidase subunit III [Acidobacteriaceae bacterium]